MTAVEQHKATAGGRITGFTLALNYLPLAQLLLGAAVVASQATSFGSGVLWSAAWLFILPPLVCRLTLLVLGAPHGRALTQETRAYRVWWFVHQWQVVFNRLPWIEELLRLVPGLYALWIFLWGGQVSPLVYWAPGSLVTDRPLVIVGAGAVIGMGAGLAGHAGTLAPDGSYRIDIAAPRVGRGAMMGARSGLGPGAELAPGVLLPAGRMIKPFALWDGSARRRVADLDGGNGDA
jgi:hypothetical protein